MKNLTVQALISIVVTLLVAGTLAWAGSQGGEYAWGAPLFALCGALSFTINWIIFIPSYLAQTERYFDFTGTLTYLTLLGFALGSTEIVDSRGILLAILVGIWALRLGSFLFRRIREDGSDPRFDKIKPNFARFLMAWTLQGLWVFLTLSCALAAMTTTIQIGIGNWAIVGTLVWIAGFSIEVVADQQKRAFRADPKNRDRFITSGLWSRSRHPNYFGEISLWVGIAIIAFPVLYGWQLLTLVSPIFVFFLLTKISGVNMLEARGHKRWGKDSKYNDYLKKTPVLIPRLGR